MYKQSSLMLFTATGGYYKMYSGNLFSSISAAYNVSSASGSFGYDANGNMTSDGLRGLTVTYFDELNLPKQYYQNSTNKVVYTYDAGGNKWSKTATVSGATSTTLYDGGFIYENGSLKKVLTSEGYYDPSAGRYYYYLKDHLGNTRLTFHYSGTTAVVDQEVEYYPFGSLFTENNLDKNKYLYNGKELNDEFFENYDYGARFYDAELGRWHVIDPMIEKHYANTPYAYVYNNPVSLLDPFGLDSTYFNLNGKAVKTISSDTDSKLLVFTNSKKTDKVDEAIKGGNVTNVPGNDVVDKMEEAYSNSEASGKENGFRVGENGTISVMVEGSEGEINSAEWKPAVDDLREKGDYVSYDAHTHPLTKDANGNVTAYGVAQPSGTDLDNVVGSQPNIVLGYRQQVTQPTSGTIGGTPTVSFVRQIGFYRTGGQVGTPMDFSRYKGLVKKINNQ